MLSPFEQESLLVCSMADIARPRYKLVSIASCGALQSPESRVVPAVEHNSGSCEWYDRGCFMITLRKD